MLTPPFLSIPLFSTLVSLTHPLSLIYSSTYLPLIINPTTYKLHSYYIRTTIWNDGIVQRPLVAYRKQRDQLLARRSAQV